MRPRSTPDEHRTPRGERHPHSEQRCPATTSAPQERLAGMATTILLGVQRCPCEEAERNRASDDDEMDLQFLGRLVNMETRTVMADRRWSIYGIKPGPETREAPEAQEEQAQQHQPPGGDHAKAKKMCPGCVLI